MISAGQAPLLKAKAVASLARAAEAFNSLDHMARTTAVLLHSQHAFEMLIKAALIRHRVTVYVRESGFSIGFNKCLGLACQHLGLTSDDAGTLRVIDHLRDAEQHWLVEVSEGILYLHLRAGVTIADDLLHAHFDDALAHHLPTRVLPISTDPPQDIQLLLDDDFTQVASLLRPASRRRAQAQARIRGLLALDGHFRDDLVISQGDVEHLERAIRSGGTRTDLLPHLTHLEARVSGPASRLTVRFTKGGPAPGVRFIPADSDDPAVAIREIDPQQKYHWTKSDLAAKLDISPPRCLALRKYLGIDRQARFYHDFVFGATTHRQYSDAALATMRDSLNTTNISDIWDAYRKGDLGT